VTLIDQAVPPGGFPRLIMITPHEGFYIVKTESASRVYRDYDTLTRDVLPTVRQELINMEVYQGSC
jgi:hypothetical protein